MNTNVCVMMMMMMMCISVTMTTARFGNPGDDEKTPLDANTYTRSPIGPSGQQWRTKTSRGDTGAGKEGSARPSGNNAEAARLGSSDRHVWSLGGKFTGTGMSARSSNNQIFSRPGLVPLSSRIKRSGIDGINWTDGPPDNNVVSRGEAGPTDRWSDGPSGPSPETRGLAGPPGHERESGYETDGGPAGPSEPRGEPEPRT